MNDNLDSHIDDILNALKGDSEKDVSRDEIGKELEKFMEYGVPLEQAKQTLIKKYGGVAVLTTSASSSERKLISDLQPNERSVKLLARVIAVNPKEVSIKGENKKIFYGILGDESGTISFTAWSNELDIQKGDVVEISNAYTREWQGAVQLNLGDRVGIKKTDKDKLPESAFEPRELKVKDLKAGVGPVDITVKILEIKARDTVVNGTTKKVFSGLIADETGKAQFTSWHDFKIKQGDVLRIAGGFVKSWKGIPQLSFDEKSTVKKLDKSKIPKQDIKVTKMPLFMLVEKKGALDVEAQGTIIEIRPGSGVIMRCPECNRSLQDSQCSVHGEVEGVPDLRVKIIIDDGTGAVSSVLNRELTEELLGKTLDECKKMKNDVLLDEINKALFSRKISIVGNALGDEFGTSVIAKEAKLIDFDIAKEAEKLSSELEELL